MKNAPFSFSKLLCLALVMVFVHNVAEAKRKKHELEDLTKGGKPFDNTSFNVGPTGLRGWAFRDNNLTGKSRQIVITKVDDGSPAAGVFEVGDVILGANGKGSKPELFSSDARVSVGKAIMDAEARDPALLKLLRWRGGSTDEVELKLETLGPYAPTAPYDCEKSRKVLIKGLEKLVQEEKSGAYGLGVLPLLAADDPSIPNREMYQAKAKEWARGLIVSNEDIKKMEAGENIFGGKGAWNNAYQLIVLSEYYLKTTDETVFPTLKALAIAYASNQSWFGTTGHILATKTEDGDNGPMAGYGAINGSGIAGFYGLILAKKAGVEHDEIPQAISRSERFFASYTDKSGIPYGEHSYSMGGWMHDMNGKSGTAAIAFSLLENRKKESRFFARMAMASSKDRQYSHAGPFFNYMWPPLGAATVGKKAVTHYFKRTTWLNDLDRRWDGKIVHSHYGIGSGGSYRNFPPEVTTLLSYALPFRQLVMTGKEIKPEMALSNREFEQTIEAEDFDAKGATDDALVNALTSWSPVPRYNALKELESRYSRSKDKASITQKIKAFLKAPDAGRIQQAAGCFALAMIRDSSSGDLLSKLLQSEDSYVRFAAAKAFRYMDKKESVNYLDTILIAVAKTGKPAFPFDDDDPLQYAHYELCSLLFYDGNAYGPRGLLANNIDGVDRKLLWPALRAAARTPVGHGRGGVGSVFKRLTEEEVKIMADTIIESIRVVAPADAMFAGAIRTRGLDVMEKFGFAEGVAVAAEAKARDHAGKVLKKYGGAAREVYPEIMQFLLYEYGVKGLFMKKHQIKEAIDIILTDEKPRELKLLKGIESVVANPPELQLPQKDTHLIVESFNHAMKDPKDQIYTWRKVYGAGKVSFEPNGSWDSNNTKVTFTEKKPGKYRFEVVMTDKLGYTSVSETVDVTYKNDNSRLPTNKAPIAEDSVHKVISGATTKIFLGGTDADGDELAYIIHQVPKHGKISGLGQEKVYQSDFGYEGQDAFLYKVVDGQGVEALGKVTLNVSNDGIGITLYEPFEQKLGDIEGIATSGIGLKGSWFADRGNGYSVVPGSISLTGLPSKGNCLKNVTGKGWGFTTRAELDQESFKRDRLLEDGQVLWMSFQLEVLRANPRMELGLEHKADPKMASIGTKIAFASYRSVVNGELQGDVMTHGRGFSIFIEKGNKELLVLKATWNEDPEGDDLFEIYRMLDLEKLGPTLIKKPLAVFKGKIDQAKLDHLYYRGGGDSTPVDEIRVGPTYESVLLGTKAL